MDETVEQLKFGYGFEGIEAVSLGEVKELIRRAPRLKVFEYYCETCELESDLSVLRNFNPRYHRNHRDNCPVHCIEELAESCPELRALELQCQAISTRTVETLVSRCGRLSSLSLYKVGGNDSEPYMALASLSHLTVLELYSCAWADDDFLSAMARSKAKLISLDIQRLKNASEDAVCRLIKVNCETLVSLSLGQTNSTSFSYYAISRSVHLKRLHLPEAASMSLFPMRKVSALPNLEYVYMKGLCYIEMYFVEHVILLGGLQNIREAHFIDCISVYDFDIVCLANEAPQLSVLLVDSCPYITACGLDLFVVSVKNLVAMHLNNIYLEDLGFMTNLSYQVPSLRLLTMFNCIVLSEAELFFRIEIERKESLRIFTHVDTGAAFWLRVLPNYPVFQRQQLRVMYELFDLSRHARLPLNIPFAYRPAA